MSARFVWLTLMISIAFVASSALIACVGGGGDDDDEDDEIDDEFPGPGGIGGDDDDDDDDDDGADDDDDDDDLGDDDDGADDDDAVDDDDALDDDAVDDDGADDDASDDDATDDDVSDDDLSPATCAEIADDMVNGCLVGFGGEDAAYHQDWCEELETWLAQFAKTTSPTWSCFDDCAQTTCEVDCFNACLDVEPTGGCTVSVDKIYDCGIGFVINGTDYQIFEAEMMKVCGKTGHPWSCYEICADTYCPGDIDTAIDCMNLC
ncbi:hypothetical protein K8I61_02260 [bacterium]|nr:hypothetical protein [bacterium]